jgi:hypothetical protein
MKSPFLIGLIMINNYMSVWSSGDENAIPPRQLITLTNVRPVFCAGIVSRDFH